MKKLIYVVKGLVEHKGKFLLLKKAKDIIPENVGKWECPGGRIKKEEDPEETLIREIKEETGLDCNIERALPPVYVETKDIYSFTHVFLVKAPSKEVKLSEEHSDFRWVKPNKVKNMHLVLFADLLLKYFEMLEK